MHLHELRMSRLDSLHRQPHLHVKLQAMAECADAEAWKLSALERNGRGVQVGAGEDACEDGDKPEQCEDVAHGSRDTTVHALLRVTGRNHEKVASRWVVAGMRTFEQKQSDSLERPSAPVLVPISLQMP
jgi:hypothetical protein